MYKSDSQKHKIKIKRRICLVVSIKKQAKERICEMFTQEIQNFITFNVHTFLNA